jgi:hypothetical protein
MPEQRAPNPDRSTWGRRCPLGCEDWPDSLEFARCLRCGEATTRYSSLKPMGYEEAMRLLYRARFNAYYAERCSHRHIPVAGPLPDWYEESLGPLPEGLSEPSSRSNLA